MKNKKGFTKIILSLLALVIIAGAMLFIYQQFGPQKNMVPKNNTEEDTGTDSGQKEDSNEKEPALTGSKEVVVEVIIPEETNETITLHTDAEFLRQALDEVQLIQGQESEFGFFITEVNNRTAKEANQEWWCITKDDEDVFYGVDEIAIQDGEHYEITLKTGY